MSLESTLEPWAKYVHHALVTGHRLLWQGRLKALFHPLHRRLLTLKTLQALPPLPPPPSPSPPPSPLHDACSQPFQLPAPPRPQPSPTPTLHVKGSSTRPAAPSPHPNPPAHNAHPHHNARPLPPPTPPPHTTILRSQPSPTPTLHTPSCPHPRPLPRPHRPTPAGVLLPRTSSKIRRHWRQPLNRATPFVAAAGHSPIALLWGKRPCRRPRFIGPPFLPGRSRGCSASGDAFSQEIPTTGEDFQCPRRPPEKHHEHRFAQHLLSKIQRADVRLLGGYLRQE